MTDNFAEGAENMNAAIHAWFDDSLDDTIRSFESDAFAHGASGKRGCALRPHITLWACSNLDLQAFSDVLAASPITSEPIPIEFDSIGAFPSPVSAIFLNPVPTAAFLGLHRTVAQILVDQGSHPSNGHYLPDKWTPHCALVSELTPEDFDKALANLRDFRRPVSGQITRLGIVERPQEREAGRIPVVRTTKTSVDDALDHVVDFWGAA